MCRKEIVFQQKPSEKADFTVKIIWLIRQWSGRPVLTNGKRPLSCAPVLDKTWNLALSRCSRSKRLTEMYKKAWRTRKVVVFANLTSSYCLFAVLVAAAVVVTEAPQDAPLLMFRSNCVWASSVKYLTYTTKYFWCSTLLSYVVPILSVLAFVPSFFFLGISL